MRPGTDAEAEEPEEPHGAVEVPTQAALARAWEEGFRAGVRYGQLKA